MLPMGHIGLERLIGQVGFFEAFGGQHFNALRQQHGRLSLHHHLVLEVFKHFDFFVQLKLEARQRLTRQRGACLGSVALPSHGIGNVDAISRQHGLCTGSPLCRQHILAVRSFQFVQSLTQYFGSAFVTIGKFFENQLQHVLRWIGQQPFPQLGRTLSRSLSNECAPRQGIKRLNIGGLRRRWGHGHNTNE